MKTKLLTQLSAIVLALTLSSCPETTVPKDFGPAPQKLDKAEWDGTWTEAGKPAEDGVVFKVTDSAGGVFEARGTGKDDKPEIAHVRSTGADDRLCFLISTDRSDGMRGPLHLISCPKENVILLWAPNHDEIARSVKSGEMKGRLVKGDKEDHQHTELDADAANSAKLLDPRFWDWSKPSVFVRAR